MDNESQKKRVLVIGLDGATFEIIKPMVKEGKLPNLGRLMRSGSYGALESSMPPITPCAWTSLVTGKDPSKHGLYDFELHEGDPEKKKSANRTFVNAKSLWRILTEAGKKSIVIDVPLTYPPEEIDGVIISRVMAPSKKNCVFPKQFYRELKKKDFIEKIETELAKEHDAGKANKEKTEVKKPRKLSKKRLRKLARERLKKAFNSMEEEIEKNLKLCEWLMREKPWDFFMIVFMSADHAGHTFWGDQVKVKKIYERLDKAVGELFEMAGEDTVKFIVSDHGFTSVPYAFNINEWLYERGLLHKKLDIPWKDSMKELRAFLKNAKKRGVDSRKKKPENKLTKFRYLIGTDYSKSKAYLQSGTSYGIRINLEGRDKTGIVKAGEYENFKNRLIGDLLKLKHPMTGRNVFDRILKKEDVYSESPFGIDPAPDIFLLTPNMEVMVEGQFTQHPKIFEKTHKGYGFHHTHGIFFADGSFVRSLKMPSPKITDVTPTVLHILGVPIPNDMDGRVLKEIFKKGSDVLNRSIEYQAPSIAEKEEKAYSKSEEKKIKKRLEALGYIE